MHIIAFIVGVVAVAAIAIDIFGPGDAPEKITAEEYILGGLTVLSVLSLAIHPALFFLLGTLTFIIGVRYLIRGVEEAKRKAFFGDRID